MSSLEYNISKIKVDGLKEAEDAMVKIQEHWNSTVIDIEKVKAEYEQIKKRKENGLEGITTQEDLAMYLNTNSSRTEEEVLSELQALEAYQLNAAAPLFKQAVVAVQNYSRNCYHFVDQYVDQTSLSNFDATVLVARHLKNSVNELEAEYDKLFHKFGWHNTRPQPKCAPSGECVGKIFVSPHPLAYLTESDKRSMKFSLMGQ